jgi:hypothetical protein
MPARTVQRGRGFGMTVSPPFGGRWTVWPPCGVQGAERGFAPAPHSLGRGFAEFAHALWPAFPVITRRTPLGAEFVGAGRDFEQ